MRQLIVVPRRGGVARASTGGGWEPEAPKAPAGARSEGKTAWCWLSRTDDSPEVASRRHRQRRHGKGGLCRKGGQWSRGSKRSRGSQHSRGGKHSRLVDDALVHGSPCKRNCRVYSKRVVNTCGAESETLMAVISGCTSGGNNHRLDQSEHSQVQQEQQPGQVGRSQVQQEQWPGPAGAVAAASTTTRAAFAMFSRMFSLMRSEGGRSGLGKVTKAASTTSLSISGDMGGARTLFTKACNTSTCEGPRWLPHDPDNDQESL